MTLSAPPDQAAVRAGLDHADVRTSNLPCQRP